MSVQMRKVTVSIPPHLFELTDEMAKEMHISRSKVISSCLQEYAKRRFEAEMKEGYKATAKEHVEFARLAMNVAHEVVPRWK